MRSGIEPQPLELLSGPVPSTRFLANDHYLVLVTARGTGFSSAAGLRLTRWAGDRVEDADGLWIYLRDLDRGTFWSIGQAPTQRAAQAYRAQWRPGKFEIERADDDIEAHLEICVPPAAAAELRRITLRNVSRRRRRIEVTTCAEVVLHEAAAYAAHPAFSKLFVQTEYAPQHRALLARRRPRADGERHPWMVHAALETGDLEFETDRARFLGRGHGPDAPRALLASQPLSGTCGNVLDPLFSLRRAVQLEPGESVRCTFLLGAASDRIAALHLVHSFATFETVDAAFEAAQVHARLQLERLAISERAAEYFQSLAGAMLYGHPGLRADLQVLARSRHSVAGMSPHRTFAVLHAERLAGAELVPEMLQAQRYWESLRLPIDLAVLSANGATESPDAPAHRVLHVEDLSASDIDDLDAGARLVVRDKLPDLAAPHSSRAVTQPVRAYTTTETTREAAASDEQLEFINGFGGFAAEGREYVIRLRHGTDSRPELPPQPWINVIANERFGFLVSETGAGYTWSRNSREHRLTPWHNDPVLDTHGEALYVRDDESGASWSPLAGPVPGDGDYEMRHGFGYSVCRHSGAGLEHETLLFTPLHDALKIARVRLTNRGRSRRRLSLFSYSRLTLGVLPEESGRHVCTELDSETGAVLARNLLAGDFDAGVTFAAVVVPASMPEVRRTCDRESFIGLHGSVAHPAALRHDALLDGRTGAGLDPCIAHQVIFELGPGETLETSFLLGEGTSVEEARALVARYRDTSSIDHAFREVREFWENGLAGLRITTPSRALDILVNGWLPYQTLACRLWARSAFYQSGGAFGFRDQLQDAAALAHLWPERTRGQILLHAAHQFVEGDVLHWWHPPLARGIRTRFADDLLWLPLVTAGYVRTTGDRGILDESVRFLAARKLAAGEDEAFLLPDDSGSRADLYEHCCRALDRSLTKGAHGLPLFGTGDWNDGMNRVGREGRGESVWMGFFLVHVLDEFVPLCERRADSERVRRYAAYREELLVALNEAGWDGGWYRRAYYDDGTPLGSSRSDECRIDALAQAWAVISGAAPAGRARQAMDAVERELISEPDGLIRLLAPPFDNTPHDPGYIKGYVPGVRENGGQYTHAALWVVRACAELGRNDRVARWLDLLNPVHHAMTPEQVEKYRVEPYVVAADVYGAPPHVGRGGWTWYTGSSGWMMRVALESLLGFRVEDGEMLSLDPCVPDDWPRFRIEYRLPAEATRYEILATNSRGRGLGVAAAKLDGIAVAVEDGVARIPLAHDGRLHRVELVLGGKETP